MAFGKNDVVIRVGLIAKKFHQGLRGLDKGISRVGRVGSQAFLGIAAASAAVGIPVGLAIRSFQKFELGLAGVQKVADFSKKELKQFENQISSLSKKIPVSTAELFETAEAAAVLGIRGSKNLTKFSETMGRMAVATDVGGEEAAKAIARIIQLSGESIDSIDQFGSALVELGNNFKASESEILSNAIRIRQSTAAYDIASTEILAMATAAREAGVQSELAGTSIGRVIRTIDLAVAEGGKDLDTLSQIMRMTREDVVKTFEESPVKAFQVFLEGLKKTNRSTAESSRLLGRLGLNGQRLMQVLPSLAKISNRLGDAVELSNNAYKENNALLNESNAFFQTSINQQKVFQNILEDFSKNVGEKFAPQWNKLVKETGQWVEQMNNPETINNLTNIADLVGKMAIGSLKLAGNMVEWIGYLSGDKTASEQLHEIELRIRKIKNLMEQGGLRGPKVEKELNDLLQQRAELMEAVSEKTKESAEKEVQIEQEKQREIANIKQVAEDIEEEKKQEKEERKTEFRDKEIEDFRLMNERLTDIEDQRNQRAIEKLRELSQFKEFMSKKDQKQLEKDLILAKKYEREKFLTSVSFYAKRSGEFADSLYQMSQISVKYGKEFFYLAQTAAVAQTIMNTATGIMKAHAEVPWPGSWVQAAAVGTAGAVQLATIFAQKPPGMRKGGIVGRAPGTPSTGDYQMAYLEPGELVTPKESRDETIDTMARKKGYNNQDIDDDMERERTTPHFTIGMEDDISDFVFVKRRMNQSLNIGVT